MSSPVLPIVPIAHILASDAICSEMRNRISAVLGIPSLLYSAWDRELSLGLNSKVDYFRLMLEHWTDLRKGRASQGELLAILRSNGIEAKHVAEKIREALSNSCISPEVGDGTNAGVQSQSSNPAPAHRDSAPTVRCSVNWGKWLGGVLHDALWTYCLSCLTAAQSLSPVPNAVETRDLGADFTCKL